ncbi:PiggyBac transposable element-derived protein 3 [Blattella germanica]|nr:PiggyBac transposable element-derived protein 3 [Blattella germanica]
MSRQKFRYINKYFHIMDNTQLKEGDKLGKISPLFDELNKHFQQYQTFHKQLSIVKSMVSYNGHHSCKMFIKENRFV